MKRLEGKVANEPVVLAMLPELSLTIVELARQRGRISISEAAEITGAIRNTYGAAVWRGAVGVRVAPAGRLGSTAVACRAGISRTSLNNVEAGDLEKKLSSLMDKIMLR